MEDKVLDILRTSLDKGVYLELDNGGLSLKTEKGEVDSLLLGIIKENREDIISHLEKLKKNDVQESKRINNKIVSIDKRSLANIPLSFNQERLRFIDKLQGSIQYHIPVVLNLSGNIDRQAAEQSFKTIINRHEILRSVLKEEDGTGYQQVMDATRWAMKYDEAATEDILSTKVAAFIAAPFDLSADYMIRVCLYSKGGNEYTLAIVFHHIASDGLSNDILLNEFAKLYNALKNGRTADLPALPLQYYDYAVWQRRNFTDAYLEDQLKFWENKLSGVSPLELPADYNRPAVQGNAGSSVHFEIGRDIMDKLNLLCKEEGVTLYMLLLSAFKVLLHRYSGQDDICVGSPVGGRTLAEMEGMAGFFANTIALRSDLGGNPAFTSLLARIKNATLDAYEYQEVPFEKVVERVVKNRDMSRNPVFQVMFSSVKESYATLVLEGAAVSPYNPDIQTSQFDLSLTIEEKGASFGYKIQYSTDLFSRSTMVQMGAHFMELLQSIIADRHQPVGKLAMLRSTDEQILLYDFNDTAVSYPLDTTAVDLFAAQVLKTPGHTAVVDGGTSYSYLELDEYSSRLAGYLTLLGVTTETLVPICIERGIASIAGILGILKAGGAYVPIAPDYPQERIKFIVEDTAATMVLSSGSTLDTLSFLPEGIQLVDIGLDKIPVTATASIQPAPIRSNNLMYVIYTSGSTGKPKGVMIEHVTAINTILSQITESGVQETDRCLQFINTTFDVSVSEIFTSLFSGASLYIIKEELKYDIDYFVQFVQDNRISIANLPPAFFGVLPAGCLSSIRTITTAGEQALPEPSRQFASHGRFINAYGPTECSIYATSFSGTITDKVPIGRPIANTQVYILDQFDNLCPLGAVGELCIGGTGVARGYLNREELTNEKFVPNPFKPGERMYRTGDLARWLADGNIEFLGRKDDQVKIRGFRMELGEIENALSVISGIKSCCVLARPDSDGNKRLIGYVVTESGLDKASIEAALKLQLPDYMVPRLWVELDAMPLTSNGKTDRKSLPDPDMSDLSSKEYVAPCTAEEVQLAAIWIDLLKVERVGINDSFFELGGHSLLATRLVSMVRTRMNTELAIKDIFKYATLSSLVSHIGSQQKGVLLPLVTASEQKGNMPLSYSQERLWFIDKFQGSVQYHMPIVLDMTGSADRDAIQQSLQAIVERHEVLRTVLTEEEGVGYQRVINGSGWTLGYEKTETGDIFRAKLDAFIAAPFDLSADYMMRAFLYERGDKLCTLVLVFHHIASDGWSNDIFLNEFTELYNALKNGRTADLQPLSLQYHDYAIWQRRNITGTYLEDQVKYWKDKLAGVSPLELHTDYTRPAEQGNSGSSLSFGMDKALADQLNLICKEEGVTLYMLLLSAFKVLLHRYSGQDDICVGSPVAGRTQAELEGMIGFFVNTLALRSDLGGNPAFTSLLARVKTATLDAYDYQQVPFEKIVEQVVRHRDMSRNPVFQVMFTLQNTGQKNHSPLQLEGVDLLRHEYDTATAKLDLNLIASENGSGIIFNLEYSTDLFSRSTMVQMGAHFMELLQSIIADRHQPVGKLAMLRSSDEQILLYDFNDTAVSYPLDTTAVDLFAAQVLKTPGHTAVVDGGTSYSYLELDEYSSRLAGYLTLLGVTTETLVPICIERGIASIAGILGILKAGGAYVPIAPDYPQERIKFIVEDTAATMVLSSGSTLDTLSFLPEGIQLVDIGLDKIPVTATASIQPAPIRSNNLMYVIYTSGSTGKPKGVMIEHVTAINTILSQITESGVQETDRCLQFINTTFDVSVSEIFTSLFSGASLYIIKEELKYDIDYFVQFVQDNRISIANLPPAFFGVLPAGCLSSIRTITTAGEQALPEPSRQFASHGRFINAYGPTECSIYATSFSGTITDKVPIGRPIANTQVYILDQFDNLCPLGAAGELCIGGAGVARGYLNREELTNEKFVPNPFKPGERMYRTGDLARWLADGNIEFLGRKDDQVKIRGFRMELGEIENALSVIRGIKSCCVLARPDSDGNKRLIGYVVTESGLDKSSIEAALKLQLPDYMVPRLWVELDAMPLTSNGKTDRKSLPDPDMSDLSSKEYVAPATRGEEQLAAIWVDLLKVERIGMNDNFFELGGHSLLATRLVSKVRSTMNIEMSLKDIFNFPTVETMSVFLNYNKSREKKEFKTKVMI